ncbi:COG0863 DNA modification methylase [uncultured Caudovirales phage]|uniref:COG0863 DNA modification methylase n=1 Tax=uncultured Caudovirales phage TaxID=2100421 RepID=A0A6J5NJQ2_9CAUD|nr:COG0863 DNA modification methylase [uncultured Caudovirales phage]
MTNLRLESVLISSLSLDPTNARRHDAKNLASIEGSLRLFGQRKPIVVTGANVVVAGNGTLEAAKALGWTNIDVVRIPIDWSPEQVKAYALADNRTAELAEWDAKVLAEQLVELDAVGWNVAEFGFDALEPPVDLTDDEPLSFDEVEPKVKLGELWQLGNHRLLCGDSTDEKSVAYLMNGELADLVFTDPPYGVNYDGGHATDKRREKLINDDRTDMYDLPLKNAYLFSKDNAALYLWFSDSFAKEVVSGVERHNWKIRNWIFWNKNMAQFGAIGAQYKMKHEPCIYAFKKGKSVNWSGPTNEVTVWDIKRDSKNEFHPTQKPVELAQRAIANHTVTNVLDLFGGSGSTLIASEATQKKAFVMELEPKYCDVIIDRWERLTGLTATRLEQ